MLSKKNSYFVFLKQKLKFPIEAEVNLMENHKVLKNSDRVKIIGLSYEDDLYGIICDIRLGRKKYSIPLVELKIDKNNSAYRVIWNYQLYFGNR